MTAFPPQTPRAFTRESILALTPGQMGVYGLFREGVWVYIGSGDVRARLLSHFNGGNPDIWRQGPTHYVTLATDDYEAREKALILSCKPICNKRLG